MMASILVDVKCCKGIKGIMKRDGRWNRMVAKDRKWMCCMDDTIKVET